jgi:hypothetical protein
MTLRATCHGAVRLSRDVATAVEYRPASSGGDPLPAGGTPPVFCAGPLFCHTLIVHPAAGLAAGGGLIGWDFGYQTQNWFGGL